MTDYRYIFGSLRDEKILASIPLQGTYMDLELNVGGRFDGTFSLDRTGYDNATVLNATIPGRSFVAVERNSFPVWIGFVWSRTYQSQAKTVQLYAQSFEKYPVYQLVRSQFSQTGEQITLFYALWAHMQAVAGRGINVNAPSAVPPTIVSRTIDVFATDYKYYSEVMSSFADASDGFDWTIGVNKTGNRYIKTLRVGYPTLGITDPSLITFDYPGSLLNYYATESMVDAGTHIFTVGAGEGSSMLTKEVAHTDLVDAGFARWDIVVPRKDIDDPIRLEGYGIQEGRNRRAPRLTLKPTLKADQVPVFGSFSLGDACTVAIQDARFPTGKRFQGRIVKWALNPQSSENTEEYTLIFDGDEEG